MVRREGDKAGPRVRGDFLRGFRTIVSPFGSTGQSLSRVLSLNPDLPVELISKLVLLDLRQIVSSTLSYFLPPITACAGNTLQTLSRHDPVITSDRRMRAITVRPRIERSSLYQNLLMTIFLTVYCRVLFRCNSIRSRIEKSITHA